MDFSILPHVEFWCAHFDPISTFNPQSRANRSSQLEIALHMWSILSSRDLAMNLNARYSFVFIGRMHG